MTEQEYFALDQRNLYKFWLYNGRVISGLLIDEIGGDKYFIVKRRDLQKYRDNSSSIRQFGIPINNLECIVHHEVLEQNSQVNNIPTSLSPIHKATKLIILGAGASYDFDLTNENHENRPPLCNDLFSSRFNELLDKYPGAKNLGAEITRFLRQGKSLEDFFQEKWDRIENNYDPILLSKIINTTYYLQELFYKLSKEFEGRRENNYTILINKIHEYANDQKEVVVIVSFNYDTLLEEAITNSIGKVFNTINDYIDPKQRIVLFKPHGSWNWVKKTTETSSGNINMKPPPPKANRDSYIKSYEAKSDFYKINNTYNSEIKIIIANIDSNLEIEYPFSNQSAFYPSLLIPYKDKDDFQMPSEHKTELSNYLNQINEIFIIGWKGTEEVFNELLKKRLNSEEIFISKFNNGDETITKEFNGIVQNPVWIEYPKVKTFTEFADYCCLNDVFNKK